MKIKVYKDSKLHFPWISNESQFCCDPMVRFSSMDGINDISMGVNFIPQKQRYATDIGCPSGNTGFGYFENAEFNFCPFCGEKIEFEDNN